MCDEFFMEPELLIADLTFVDANFVMNFGHMS